MVRRRTVIAVVLSFLFPGLGHAYVRQWLRAAGFAAMAVAVVFLFGPSIDASGSLADTVATAWTSLSVEANLAMSVVEFVAMLDVYLLVTATADAAPESCPNCGRELDDELAFCPWCAHELVPE
ncbi:DUF6677 family protein [Haloarchaeobius sp. HRN-SO-5]|uniref:DUF6677 family protein n=1 Tax=Haloarchaeobius sp. HRN-SO-5 TaxID=3446118 RepID=UPI003EBD54A2